MTYHELSSCTHAAWIYINIYGGHQLEWQDFTHLVALTVWAALHSLSLWALYFSAHDTTCIAAFNDMCMHMLSGWRGIQNVVKLLPWITLGSPLIPMQLILCYNLLYTGSLSVLNLLWLQTKWEGKFGYTLYGQKRDFITGECSSICISMIY